MIEGRVQLSQELLFITGGQLYFYPVAFCFCRHIPARNQRQHALLSSRVYFKGCNIFLRMLYLHLLQEAVKWQVCFHTATDTKQNAQCKANAFVLQISALCHEKNKIKRINKKEKRKKKGGGKGAFPRACFLAYYPADAQDTVCQEGAPCPPAGEALQANRCPAFACMQAPNCYRTPHLAGCSFQMHPSATILWGGLSSLQEHTLVVTCRMDPAIVFKVMHLRKV